MTDPDAALALPWRTGMHVGRTIYAMAGPEPTKVDLLIGVMDTPELAALAVHDHNQAILREQIDARENQEADRG